MNVLERVIRQENGGSNPFSDDLIRLKVKVEDKIIWVFVVGKWRSLRGYNGKGQPGKRIMEEVAQRVMVNTGWNKVPEIASKKIEWVWQ